MILSLAVIGIIAIVAYFHYLQGLFSAALSALLALVAAIVAVGWHEWLIKLVNGGAFSDYATATVLISLFAVTYIVLRAIFDAAVPGNVRFPLMVDRIGAAVMGLVAGLLSCGVLCIAAQSMRLPSTIAMYDQYALETRTVPILVAGQYTPRDTEYETLANPEKYIEGEGFGLIIPADRLVLSLVERVTDDGGALDNGTPFAAVHPNYLQELYGQRLSLQSGSKRTALAGSVDVADIYTIDGRVGFPQDDNERWVKDQNGTGIRGPKAAKPAAKLEPVAKPGIGRMFLILRVTLQPVDADEKTSYVSFTPAAVRLVANRKNYFPVGTLEAGRILFHNDVDDVLFVPGGKQADLVFDVPEADFSPDSKDPASRKLAPDVFFEFKRFARVNLAGRKILPGVTDPPASVEVARKDGMPSGSAGKLINSTLVRNGAPRITNTIESPVNIATSAQDAKGDADWGSFALAGRRALRLEVNPVRSIALLGKGQELVADYAVAKDKRMVMVPMRPSNGKEPWNWADDLGNYQLVDDQNTRFKPSGVYAKLNNNGQEMMLVRYDADKTVSSVPATNSMRPTDVTLLFILPKNAQIRSMQYKKDLLALMPLKVE